MKIVLDTNVLISGLLQPYGSPGQIVRTVSSGTLQLCHDSRILSEYREVLLRPKFNFPRKDVDSLLEQIEFRGYPVSAEPLRISFPDPDDVIFLEVALSGRVPYLVTGNLKHFSEYKGKEVKILSPAAFLRVQALD